jgi:phage gpG-like protein
MENLAPALEAPVDYGVTAEVRAPQNLFALKDKDTFIVADEFGDIAGQGDGLFHNDTRILSLYRLTLGGRAAVAAVGGGRHDNVFFTCNSTNQALPYPGGGWGRRACCTSSASASCGKSGCSSAFAASTTAATPSCCRCRSSSTPISTTCSRCAAPTRQARGQGAAACRRPARRLQLYRPGRRRACVLHLVLGRAVPPGTRTRPSSCSRLHAEGETELYIEIGIVDGHTPSRERFRDAAARARWDMRARRRHGARLNSSGRLFNEWLGKSRSDLALLTTKMETGPYPYAGIPWFSTAFGRDAIITAWQILWFEPSLAKGVLRYLAAHQAHERSTFRDSAARQDHA